MRGGERGARQHAARCGCRCWLPFNSYADATRQKSTRTTKSDRTEVRAARWARPARPAARGQHRPADREQALQSNRYKKMHRRFFPPGGALQPPCHPCRPASPPLPLPSPSPAPRPCPWDIICPALPALTTARGWPGRPGDYTSRAARGGVVLDGAARGGPPPEPYSPGAQPLQRPSSSGRG